MGSPSLMVVTGRICSSEAAVKLNIWFKDAVILTTELDARIELEHDCLSLHMSATVRLRNSENLNANPPSDIPWRTVVIICFEPSSWLIRNIFIRRVQGEEFLETIGKIRSGSGSILGTGRANDM